MAPAAMADATDFEGFFGGLSVGSVAPTLSNAPSIDSAIGYGIFAGYDHALNSNWVVGGELSYGMSGAHSIPSFAGSLDLENILTVSARTGYAFGNTLVYGRLGYQTLDIVPSTAAASLDGAGVTFGLGIEQMFTEALSGRVEISRSNLDVSGPAVPAGIEMNATTVSVGIAYRF